MTVSGTFRGSRFDCITPEDWLFAWQCFVLSGESRTEITGYEMNPEVAGQLPFTRFGPAPDGKDTVLDSIPAPHSPVDADFGSMPLAAVPVAIACAALGVPAQFHGLSSLMDLGGRDLVAPLQRELYRFGVQSDFCDRSKLKIYDERPIRKKNGPVDLRAGDRLAFFFLPLTIKLGTMDIQLERLESDLFRLARTLFVFDPK